MQIGCAVREGGQKHYFLRDFRPLATHKSYYFRRPFCMEREAAKTVPIYPRPFPIAAVAASHDHVQRQEQGRARSSMDIQTSSGQGPTKRYLALYEHSSCAQQLTELRCSHAALTLKLSELEQEVRTTRKIALETESFVRGPNSIAEKTILRVVMFANIAARHALTSYHSEMSKTYPCACPANSVRQIDLRSKPTDCSLSDFKILANHCMTERNIKCRTTPSIYHALLSSTSSANSFQIVFDSFADICDALQFAYNHREASVYRERKNLSRNLRSVQVLGVDLLQPSHSDSLGTRSERRMERKILLSRSFPTSNSTPEGDFHVLHQLSTAWTEQSWDHGLHYQLDTHKDLSGFSSNTTSKSFTISWERKQDSPYPRDASSDLIPGSLRSSFPAVVLRTQIITTSAKKVFSGTFNGTSLQHLLCSTAINMEGN